MRAVPRRPTPTVMHAMEEPNVPTRPPGQPHAAPPVPALSRIRTRPTPALTKLLLVDFRSGEAVHQHPEISPFLQQGWRVRSAVPRLVEAKGTRLLVVLTQGDHDVLFRPFE